jgi:hypothetical protein
MVANRCNSINSNLVLEEIKTSTTTTSQLSSTMVAEITRTMVGKTIEAISKITEEETLEIEVDTEGVIDITIIEVANRKI